MRVHTVGVRPGARLALGATAALAGAAILTGGAAWCWTQAACLASLHAPMRLPAADAASATWRLLLHGGWSTPARAFPRRLEQGQAPGARAYLLVAGCSLALAVRAARRLALRVAGWRRGHRSAGSGGASPAARCERGWVAQRTWALAADLRRLWVAAPVSGRPYLA